MNILLSKMPRNGAIQLVCAAAWLSTLLVGCGAQTTSGTMGPEAASEPFGRPIDRAGSGSLASANAQGVALAANEAPVNVGDAEVLSAQANQAVRMQVTVEAPVFKKLPDDTRGLPHEKFLIRLSNGTTVLIAHDTKYAPYVPLQAGDTVIIHGEYIWNRKGGLIHWTHLSDTPRHESGWIIWNGRKYQ